jgi:hypothetical protein
MAEVTLYSFAPKELLTVLIKAADLHEGDWMIAPQFNNVPLPGGPALGLIVIFAGIALQRAPASPPENALIVDAAKVNPLRSRGKVSAEG